MLDAHSQTLGQARSCIAALADSAAIAAASSAYEQALLQLDVIHADEVPALDTGGMPADRGTLFMLATSAVEELASHGVDGLQIQLVLALLDDARDLDEP